MSDGGTAAWTTHPAPIGPGADPADPPPGASALWIGMITLALSAFAGAALSTDLLSDPRFQVLAVCSTIGAVAALIAAALIDVSLRWWRRWAFVAVIVASAAALVIARFCWTAFGGWMTTITIILTFPLVAVAGLCSIALPRHRPVSRLLGVAAAVGFFVLWHLGLPRPLPSLAVRLEAGGSRDLTAEAETLLADPPENDLDDLTSPFVVSEGDVSVVGWRMIDGIPARSWGLVYAPDGMPPSIGGGPDTLWSVRGCEPVTGDWYWCRVY